MWAELTVQMRFPIQPMADRHPEYQPHHMTLLDGELIVDEERDTGKHTYKFLAYDLMALNYSCKVHKPWKVCSAPFRLALKLFCPLNLCISMLQCA